MNLPTKTDATACDSSNQATDHLSADLTITSDAGKAANARIPREFQLTGPRVLCEPDTNSLHGVSRGDSLRSRKEHEKAERTVTTSTPVAEQASRPIWMRWPAKLLKVLRKYCKFVGPGFMISVAYIDPGNYATDVAAGASYRFKLLFMILLSNIFAIFLQSLCIDLGSVTGMNLAQMTRAHCPRWLNLVSYVFAEGAIIATDIAEVIGTAIAINLLSNGKVPLVAGCAISILDVLVILLLYRQNGASLKARRLFEGFVALLVIGVVICFCIQLSYIRGVGVGDVFHGFVPSSALVQGQGLYQACGILGATVMPHSLYLGSGIVQDRLKDYDREHDLLPATEDDSDNEMSEKEIYQPSLQAIRSCRGYSIAECAVSLFTFALFINSAILIVAGASLYNVDGAQDASLFGVYHLLSRTLAPAVATLFAVSLLLSGTSAGIVCTIAGQMVSEGQIRLQMKPWKQRMITRSISIVPSIIVAGALGGAGVNKALVGSQVALSVILPFVSAPLIWFTAQGKYMTVLTNGRNVQRGEAVLDRPEGTADHTTATENRNLESVNMRSHPIKSFFAVIIWGIIVIMNVALLVLLGLGKT